MRKQESRRISDTRRSGEDRRLAEGSVDNNRRTSEARREIARREALNRRLA